MNDYVKWTTRSTEDQWTGIAMGRLAEMLSHGYVMFYARHAVFYLDGKLNRDERLRASASLKHGVGPALLNLHAEARELWRRKGP